MFFYIDPGTGSMLFTILIGVLGAVIYALRNSWMKLKVMVPGKKAQARNSVRTPFVFVVAPPDMAPPQTSQKT